MKIQARSIINGLVQQVDINMAHCSPLCHEPPEEPEGPTPEECTLAGGLYLEDGVYDGPEGHIEATTQGATAFGAPFSTQTFGWLNDNPAGETCPIENQEAPFYTLSMDVVFAGEPTGITVGVQYEISQDRYYLVVTGDPVSLPAETGCFALGNGVCNEVNN